MKRKIITIDNEKCDGCGLCLPNCPEGAIRVVDGKARLLSDRFCDGLGACMGHCPRGAIRLEEREAEAYDERQVIERIIPQGRGVIRAHLEHLRDHGLLEDLAAAVDALREHGTPHRLGGSAPPAGGCRARLPRPLERPAPGPAEAAPPLSQWPVQLHLLSPDSPAFRGADVLLAADCAPCALADFHARFLKGRRLAIACPKLDTNQEVYIEKLRMLIDVAAINTLTVLIMEVPCCRGLLNLAREAAARAAARVPIKCIVAGIRGEPLSEQWIWTTGHDGDTVNPPGGGAQTKH